MVASGDDPANLEQGLHKVIGTFRSHQLLADGEARELAPATAAGGSM